MARAVRRAVLLASPLAVVGVLALLLAHKIETVETEARRLAETGQGAIRLLGAYAAAVQELDHEALLSAYDETYDNPAQGVWRERLVSERDGIRIWAWEEDSSRPFGKAEMGEEIGRFLSTVGRVTESKFKLASVEEIQAPDAATVRAVLWLRGVRGDGETFESHVHFRLALRRSGRTWRIQRQEFLRGETVTGPGRGFRDVAEEAGIHFVARHNPRFQTPEWELKKYEIAKYASAGVSAADYDGDGWYDLFFADGAAPRLYRNRGDGTFTDATVEAGLPPELDGVNVALFGDLDNDGDQDLFLGRITGENRLYRNDGDGTFTDVTEGAGLGGHFVTVAAAGDYDNDGLLDLYIGRYLDPRTDLPTTLFYSRNGMGNSLLRNLGDLRFADVTEEAGVGEGGLALGVAWGDYDRDGDQDLYVANDFGRNALFRNEGDGTFTDVAAATGTLDFGYGMSATFGDFDNDGDLDLYVSNVHSGQRWYGQAPSLYRYLLTSIRQGTILEDFPLYREVYRLTGPEWHRYGDRVVKGNSLLLNDGQGHFTDVSELAGANPFGWFWGTAILDFDNDGLQDLYAGNGWISGKVHDDL